MFGFYFKKELPKNYLDMVFANNDRFNFFFQEMLKKGVFFAPSMYEAGFVCAKHDLAVIEQTLNLAEEVFKIMAQK